MSCTLTAIRPISSLYRRSILPFSVGVKSNLAVLSITCVRAVIGFTIRILMIRPITTEKIIAIVPPVLALINSVLVVARISLSGAVSTNFISLFKVVYTSLFFVLLYV